MQAHFQKAVDSSQGHSANVQLLLHINNQTIRLSQAGRYAIKPSDGLAVPSGAAQIEIIVDGISRTRSVTIPLAGQPGDWTRID